MIEIDSLVITRLGTNYWVYAINGAAKPDSEDAYTGSLSGDLITIKSLNGAPKILQVHYSVIDYYDNLDPLNNLTNPSSAQEMFGHLLEQNFFIGSNGTGGGGITTLKQLLDVNIPIFAGNELKYLRINADGTFVIADESPVNNLKLQNLVNYNGPAELPLNFALVTSPLSVGPDAEVGFSVAPLYNLINRPPKYDELYVSAKGYTIVDDEIVPNVSELALEIGDLCKFWYQEAAGEPIYRIEARYKGGSTTDLNNFEWIDRYNYKFTTEPF